VEASHNDRVNQALHLVSSSVFIYCYGVAPFDLTQAMCLGLAALTVRKFARGVLEPAYDDKEERLLRYTTRDKTIIVFGYAFMPSLVYWFGGPSMMGSLTALLDAVAWRWFEWTVFVVTTSALHLTWTHGWWYAVVWFLKLVTDPFVDIAAHSPRKLLKA
jgi:glutamate-1-semialdehyde 2,1-aminomutase